jgi:hypothetical protein
MVELAEAETAGLEPAQQMDRTVRVVVMVVMMMVYGYEDGGEM